MINPEYSRIRRVALAARVALWVGGHFLSNTAAVHALFKIRETLDSTVKSIYQYFLRGESNEGK